MVIKTSRLILVVSTVVLASGLGVLCIVKIIAIRDVVEVLISACAHNGFVAIFHGFAKQEDGH